MDYHDNTGQFTILYRLFAAKARAICHQKWSLLHTSAWPHIRFQASRVIPSFAQGCMWRARREEPRLATGFDGTSPSGMYALPEPV